MSASVTPMRRRRSQVNDAESSDAEPDSLYSEGSKRARLETEDNEDEQPDSPERPLLPNSYRRSPKGKQRALEPRANGPDDGEASQKYQPGSIVRVTLVNFVTYTKAEFLPGPNLNMVIGPNGTGKSTLVCAICLGLGWATSHLGRAKDIGEFVNKDARKAEIQIELAADPERHETNPVITTKIIRDGNKSEYYIDGRKSNRKGVQALARSFSIQVDNLCQFLPQDRVAEFAALSPVDLLVHTQRAAAPEAMTIMHEELKTMRKDQKQQQSEMRNLDGNLKSMENRQRLQEADVQRLLERREMQKRRDALEKMRPFPQYMKVRSEYDDAKKQLKSAEKEFQRLARNLEPSLRATEIKKEYLGSVEKVDKQRQNLVQRSQTAIQDHGKKLHETQDKIQGCQTEIESEKQTVKQTKSSIQGLRQNLSQIKRAIDNPPPEYDFAETNEQIRQKTRQIREIESRRSEISESQKGLGSQLEDRNRLISTKEREKQNLQSQAGQQESKLKRISPQSARAWEWIQNNRRRFQSPVYGPPMVECSVRDKAHAGAVETVIPLSEMLAITVTSQADFNTLQQQVYGEMRLHDVRLRNCTQSLAAFKPSIPREQLREYGLDCYMLELIDGPDAVLAMLCDNRNLHQAAFASHEIPDQQYERIKATSIGSFVTPTKSYTITRRREYGPNAISARVNPVKQAETFTDAPVDRQFEMDLNRDIDEAKDEIEEIKKEHGKLVNELKTLSERQKGFQEEKQALEDDKQTKQRALAEYQGLTVRRDTAQDKLDSAHERIAAYEDRRREIDERHEELSRQEGQQALDLANSVDMQRKLHIQLFESEILRGEATSELEQLEAQHAEEQRLLDERQIEVDRLKKLKDELHKTASDRRDRCQELSGTFDDADAEVYQEVMQWSIDELETEIESARARLEMTLGGGNENTLVEFEKRAEAIAEKRARLEEVQSTLQDLEVRIAEIRQRWEPELDALVGEISEAFAENFAQIQCAGQVGVHKDEDFENWAIQIKVKFRENEGMSILNSQRQSGGERAVSTIFYLMALQSLARAPFRVVDEINQGMDPRNERKVHCRMVDIACSEHTSQYFLITPKLLEGLKYVEGMKVHCIASGECMPSDPSLLDFARLARQALEARRGGFGAGMSAATA